MLAVGREETLEWVPVSRNSDDLSEFLGDFLVRLGREHGGCVKLIFRHADEQFSLLGDDTSILSVGGLSFGFHGFYQLWRPA